MGVNLFGGRFRSCLDASGNLINVSLVANEVECNNKSLAMNYTWHNPKINFDNVLTAYLALFQVVSQCLFHCMLFNVVLTLSINQSINQSILLPTNCVSPHTTPAIFIYLLI